MNKVVLCSHVGNSRSNQEDNAFLPDGQFLDPEKIARIEGQRQTLNIATHCGQKFLVAVSDGMGGHACGEVASAATVQFLSSHHDEIIHSVKAGESALIEQIANLNRAVSAMAKKDSTCRGMGATLCGMIANEYVLWGFNVGDSRLYQFQDGTLKQLSTDHTEGQRLLRMQLLTEEEIKRFPRRKVLHKYIGCDGALVADIFPITGAQRGTVFLLCTDGLSDVLSDAEIEQVLRSGTGIREKAAMLVNEAVSRNMGHGDNITAILVEF